MKNITTTINEVVNALIPLSNIARPDGDNENDSINDDSVFNFLSDKEQGLIDEAQRLVRDYVITVSNSRCVPNQRAITELNHKGFATSLSSDQYDPNRLVGAVQIISELSPDSWRLNISDRLNEN
jgi:hypothetical protein